jgi:hypothetical protein
MKRGKHYVVTFYKTVTSDYGRDVEIQQDVIKVAASDEQHALDQAKDEFCRRRGLHDYSLHADRYEVRQRSLRS